jgi:hypothetical protein
MVEFIHILSASAVLLALWSSDDCSGIYSVRIFLTLYVIVVFIGPHYFKSK